MACLAKMNKADLLPEAKKLQKVLEEEKKQKVVHEDTILRMHVELQESVYNNRSYNFNRKLSKV